MRGWRIICQPNPNQEKAKRAMITLKKDFKKVFEM